MGEKTVPIDKFFRTIGMHRRAKEAVQNMETELLEIFSAYADGINDYVSHLGYDKTDSTGFIFPPEFLLLGITEFQPWTPEDSVSIFKLLNFRLSWNWGHDLNREIIQESGLEDMVEEIFPFTAEFSHNLVTIIDAEDLVNSPFWSNETLVERYTKAKEETKKANFRLEGSMNMKESGRVGKMIAS
jgi:acyl-homoserine lactone acylase PvdQ